MFGVISSADCRFSALCTPLHSTCKCKSGSHPVSCNISGCKLLFFFDKLCIFVCMYVCVCVCMQRQQVCSFVWKKHQTVLDPQCAFCVCVDLCGWVCQRMWVFYILQTFQAALLAFKNKKIKKKKVPNREPCLFACHLWVGCTLLGTPAFLLASHWIPAGGHWGATTHRASVTNEGESVPHHIEK